MTINQALLSDLAADIALLRLKLHFELSTFTDQLRLGPSRLSEPTIAEGVSAGKDGFLSG